MHPRFHAAFSASLHKMATLPADSPLQNPYLFAGVTIVLEQDGSLRNVTVEKSSGVDEFDQYAVEAVRAAGSFAPLPPELSSPGTYFGVTWFFYRDERTGCNGNAAEPFRIGPAPDAGASPTPSS
jgi:TonB family protein